jgi:hypothetical protein
MWKEGAVFWFLFQICLEWLRKRTVIVSVLLAFVLVFEVRISRVPSSLLCVGEVTNVNLTQRTVPWCWRQDSGSTGPQNTARLSASWLNQLTRLEDESCLCVPKMLTAFTGVALLILLAENCLLAHEAVWFYRYIPTFRRKNPLGSVLYIQDTDGTLHPNIGIYKTNYTASRPKRQ